SGGPRKFAVFAWGNERSGCRDSGEQGLFQAEIRKRRASRTARSRDRAARAHPHFGGNGRRVARSRRNRHQDRAERSAHRHFLLLRPRRPVCEHHLFRRAHHTFAYGLGRFATGRKIPNQESRKGHARSTRAPLRTRAGKAASGHRRRAPRADQKRRSIRENRSEERRVGKEGRERWWQENDKEREKGEQVS